MFKIEKGRIYMTNQQINVLDKMKVLLSNDDGISAPGMQLLESIIKKYK